jgi:hypothetical protein
MFVVEPVKDVSTLPAMAHQVHLPQGAQLM